MDNEIKLARKQAKKQKKEERRIGKKSREIIASIAHAFQKETMHGFNAIGLLKDKKPECEQEYYELSMGLYTEKIQKTAAVVNQAGPVAIAHTMRHYCQILSDPNRTQEESSEAMLNAVHLLYIIAGIAKHDVGQLNTAVIDSCARDASMVDLKKITDQQWVEREVFYSPELKEKILADSKVRTIA